MSLAATLVVLMPATGTPLPDARALALVRTPDSSPAARPLCSERRPVATPAPETKKGAGAAPAAPAPPADPPSQRRFLRFLPVLRFLPGPLTGGLVSGV